jgi:uncharacterized integral membrane protein
MLKLRRRSQIPPPSPAMPNTTPTAPAVPEISAPVHTPPRTIAGTTWVLTCIAALVLVALIVFLAQNAGATKISFFSLHGRFPLSVALLAAAVAGCLLTLAVGSTRILQLRRVVRRRRRDDRAASAPTAPPQNPDITPDASQLDRPEHGRAGTPGSNGKLES